MTTAQKFAKYFELTKSMIHMDLSHCGYSTEELEIISKGFEKNHSILGIHLTGNSNFKMSTNSLGYLEKEKLADVGYANLWTRIPTSSKNANKKMMEFKGSGGCYICEGWREVRFVWKNPNPSVDPGKSRITILTNRTRLCPFLV